MKKVLTVFLALLLCFGLTACGGSDNDTPKEDKKDKVEKKDEEKKSKEKDAASVFKSKGYKDNNGNFSIELKNDGNVMYILFSFYGGDCKNDMLSITYNNNPTITIVYNQNYGGIDTCRYDYANNTFISGYEGTEDQKQQIINGKSNFDDILDDLGLNIEDLNKYSISK